MKPLMTRWKTVPEYRAPSPLPPERGSVHSPVPSASPTKLRTVAGAWFGKSSTRMAPLFVVIVACSATGGAPGVVGRVGVPPYA